MSIFKCKMCGGDVEISDDKTIGICGSCGTTATFPKISDEQKLDAFNRGNYFRRIGEFDKALQVYEHIVQEEPENAEAHWCCALCRFGIEYVEDPVTFEYIPTCHRASFDIFTEDVDYLAAVESADGITRKQYQKDGAKITEVQRGILATSQNEKPFDVFICYKETDDNGERTVDSMLAQDIYYQLTDAGLRVFFARITLEDKVGSEYEPYIFAALNSAKAMICVGTKADNFNAVWVKNEWSRFIALMRHNRGKVLLPCYKDMNPYDMPEQLSVLQSYDMSKIGFIQDLIRGIKKITAVDEPKAVVKETVVVNNANIAPLLKRAFMFLEDGDFDSANEYCERVLDQDPECAEAYLGKLMAELKVKTKDSLKDVKEPFDKYNNCIKASKFNAEIAAKLKADNDFIRDAKENARKQVIYDEAKRRMDLADTEDDFKAASSVFDSILGFKDADEQKKICLEKAEHARELYETSRKQGIYLNAQAIMTRATFETDFKQAASLFDSISGFKDADEQSKICIEKAESFRIAKIQSIYDDAINKMSKAHTENEFKSIAKIFFEIADFKDADELKKKCIEKAEEARKNAIYDLAKSKMGGVKISSYKLAIKDFESIIDWKDSRSKIDECNKLIANIRIAEEKAETERKLQAEEARIAKEKKKAKTKKIAKIVTPIVAVVIVFLIVLNSVIIPAINYKKALAAVESGDYSEAYTLFNKHSDYKDTQEQIKLAKEKQADSLLAENKYEEACKIYEGIGKTEKVEECKYAKAIEYLEAKDYESAYALFNELGDTEKINENKYNRAIEFVSSGDKISAYPLFAQISGYKDADTKAAEYKSLYVKNLLSKAIVGDTVIFGSYEQDNNTDNGKEDIEWRVLEVKDGKALIISDKAIDCVQYNEEFESTTWETCTLRTWLNGTFYKAAFSIGEQAIIADTKVTADENPEYSTDPGNDTTDKVFLLSITEVEKYFSSDDDMICKPTEYAVSNGAYVNDSTGGCWWLRSPGYYSDRAAYVYGDGGVNYGGSYVGGVDDCVRPALWIEI